MTERASVVDDEGLLPQLVAHLREHRTRLRQEWAGRIHEAHLLQAMTARDPDARPTAEDVASALAAVANDLVPPAPEPSESTQPMAIAPTPAISPARPPTISTSAYWV